MGSAAAKPDKFSVRNESDSKFRVHVSQITERKISQFAQSGLDIDAGKAADSVMNAETPAGKVIGLVGAFKSSSKKASQSQFVRNESTFAVIGGGKSLTYNLPSGKDAEVFVTITQDVPRGEEENAIVLCSDYSPPSEAVIYIDKDMNLRIQ